jgi:hypothetical protein
VRFWAKSKGFGVFVARILYIYEMKIINQQMRAWVSAEPKGIGFFASHYS